MSIELLTGIIALIAAIGTPCIGFGLLKGRVEALEKDTARHSASIGKLFDSQRDVSTLTAKLEGRLEVIETTLNRIAEKIERVLER